MTTSFVDSKLYLNEKRDLTDRWLDTFLPSVDEPPEILHTAMRYSVLAGGKRLRPILAYAAWEYCGGKESGNDPLPIHYAMVALEMVHTYSLIHDDLPCMDDDDLRRGIPSAHKKFGEAVAVLAGDALHDVAFELMAETKFISTITELARAIGTKGMIGGQVADVSAEGKSINREEIINIHSRKTAALIRCSVRTGAIIGGADSKLYNKLSLYGEKIGLAFQIIDDILDVEGDQELLGKTVGSDDEKQKATYPGVVGMETARRDATQLIEESIELFDPGDRENRLCHIAAYIGQRNS